MGTGGAWCRGHHPHDPGAPRGPVGDAQCAIGPLISDTSRSRIAAALKQHGGKPFMGGERTAAELLRRDPHWNWGGTRTFDGGGSVNNTETLTSTIQARVTDVLPNRVMR